MLCYTRVLCSVRSCLFSTNVDNVLTAKQARVVAYTLFKMYRNNILALIVNNFIQVKVKNIKSNKII